MQPAILVTGAPRSGTTFVGKMLCLPRHMTYLDEPFNFQTGLQGVKQPLVYLGDDTPQQNHYYLGLINKLLAGQAHFRPSSLPGLDEHPLKRTARKVLRSRSELHYKIDALNPVRSRYLIKDPMACLAAGYLHEQLGLNTIVIIRHPASTIASFKRLRWHYSLSDLTEQPELMQRYLEPVLGPVNTKTLTTVQTWAYFWLCLYTVLDDYLKKYPNIKAVTHEQLSRQPQREFEELFRHCDLPMSAKVKHSIDEHTKSTNPSDPGVGEAHALRRNSAANIHRWHKILEPDEVNEIRRITEPVSSKYYSDADW